METTIRLETDFGEAQFIGPTPGAADKALKKVLRKAGVSINDLAFYQELEMNFSHEVLYGYTPIRPRYNEEKAKKILELSRQEPSINLDSTPKGRDYLFKA